ncbi:hypothetical protein SASPL_150543 [Salvia splendens]|uniref:Uncharacterized protein n=1 Tax=Salvia splendens TaxID=180675 RepID=A0A8X8Z2R9_SALSN|nr:hypothetical protein SASPL_150543 [Salvia splendens]
MLLGHSNRTFESWKHMVKSGHNKLELAQHIPPKEKGFSSIFVLILLVRIESAEANLARSEVSVKGVVEPTALADYVYKKTGKLATIVKVEAGKKEEEKAKEEKKAEEAESKKAEGDGKENSGKEAAKTEEEKDLKMEVRKNEM